MNGRIIKGLGGLYEIVLADGTTVNCKARGSFRRAGVMPYVGDYVTVRTEGDDCMIDGIDERKNLLIRPPLANLDYLIVCIPAAKPEPAVITIDQLLSIAEHQGIEPVIVITKCDLAPERAARLADIYTRAGYPVYSVCGITGAGVDMLTDFFAHTLAGGTAAFAGASGVGKTTLMNALFPALDLKTGGISEKIERGKHTTRHVELYDLSRASDIPMQGYLADTPGFSMLDFVRFDFYSKEDLPYAFREFAPYLHDCRYSDCTHTKEEGCAVLAAVRDGMIAPSRHESFLAIYADLKDKKPWNSK